MRLVYMFDRAGTCACARVCVCEMTDALFHAMVSLTTAIIYRDCLLFFFILSRVIHMTRACSIIHPEIVFQFSTSAMAVICSKS